MTFPEYLSTNKSSFFERIGGTQDYEMSPKFLLLFKDISRGIQFLHDNMIIHGNVKTNNTLIKIINDDKVTEFNAGKQKDWRDLKKFITDCFKLFGYNMSEKTRLFCTMLSSMADIVKGMVVETHPIFGWTDELKMRFVRFLSTTMINYAKA